jgi:GDPmannose 4,6-dehydratase
MRAVIFGAGGQDGFYLKELLMYKKIEFIGISRKGNFIIGDISDYSFVVSVFNKYRPDYIFNLAANSSTKHDILFENHNTISTGTINILEAARLNCPTAKIFLSGSALQFKNDGNPINENTPFEAKSPYAVSRIHSIYAARYYRDVYNLKIYIGYFFNHDGPLRSENFINQKIVRAVQRINKGSNERLELGNIDVQKEFGFAGDSVKAIWILVNQDLVFEAIIGTGKAYSIRDWLVQCFEMSPMNWNDFVVLKEDFIPEYKILVSDPKLIKSLGWMPEIGFKQLAELMMLN